MVVIGAIVVLIIDETMGTCTKYMKVSKNHENEAC